jgi:hypothetical protein
MPQITASELDHYRAQTFRLTADLAIAGWSLDHNADPPLGSGKEP